MAYVDLPSFSSTTGYSKAASNTMVVGHALGRLTESIYSFAGRGNLKSFCVGHSLGSHICGFTGKIKQLDGIIALDPAGVFFETHYKENRIDKGDAKYVEAIHTDAGELGLIKPVGHVDIYLNGGKQQPYCTGWTNEIGCSHLFPLWFLPTMWERSSNGSACHASFKCSDMTDFEVCDISWSIFIFNII